MPASRPRTHLRHERTYADETPLATSFRVYTPAEIRTSRLPFRVRPSVLPPEEKLSPETLAKAVGVAAAALVAVFVAFLVIGNLTDDAKLDSGVSHTAAAAVQPPPFAPVAAPVEAPSLLVVGDPPTDFEIPDDTPVRTAAKPKAKKRRQPRP